MPIEQKRIEAAARERYEHTYGLSWDYAAAATRAAHIKDITAVAKTLFPELASDPPTGWVAPMALTAAMSEAQGRVWWYGAEEMWQAARDAHIKEQGE